MMLPDLATLEAELRLIEARAMRDRAEKKCQFYGQHYLEL